MQTVGFIINCLVPDIPLETAGRLHNTCSPIAAPETRETGFLATRLIFFCQLQYITTSMQYIEDIQMFLLNMAFISSSEVENIYIS